MDLSASSSGWASIVSSLFNTASKPRFMLAPWSPSPMAWSSAVNSGALAMTCSAAALTSDLNVSGCRDMVMFLHSGDGGDSLPRGIEVKRMSEVKFNLLAWLQRLVGIGQRDHGLAS